MLTLYDSEEICEALVRYVEVSGYEVFEKNFVKDGHILCTVWCMVGSNAEAFNKAIREWLDNNGFGPD